MVAGLERILERQGFRFENYPDAQEKSEDYLNLFYVYVAVVQTT